MNILLTSLMVPGAPSGVRVHYERLAEGLRQEGHTVTIVTQDSLRPWVRRGIGIVRRALGLFGGVGKHVGKELGFVAEIFWAIDRSIPYDVVNAQDVSSGWAARLALGTRIPVVVTGHFNDHPGEELIRQLHLTGLSARFLQDWYNFLLRRTQYFIGVSDYVRQRTLPWLPGNALTEVVYNGVAMNASSLPANDETPDLHQLYPGRTVLLNVGQLEPRKNQRALLPIAAQLRQKYPNFVLVIVGRGEDESLLTKMIVEAGLQREVVLLGYHRNVMALLRTADLYVHVATRENCPLVLVEAMAASCPIAALAVGGIPELLSPTPQALLPVAASTAEWAEQLYGLISTPESLAQLRRQQRAFGEAHFEASLMVANTLGFFRKAQQHFSSVPTNLLLPDATATPPAYAHSIPDVKDA